MERCGSGCAWNWRPALLPPKMVPPMKGILRLWFALCGFAWAGSTMAAPGDQVAGLSAEVVVPSPVRNAMGAIPGKFVVTNHTDKAIRFCATAMAWRGVGGGRFTVLFSPEHWKSDPLPVERLAAGVKTIEPGKTLEMDFEILGDAAVIEIEASYELGPNMATKLDAWHGLIRAKTVTIRPQ